jgi:hypothetical protein
MTKMLSQFTMLRWLKLIGCCLPMHLHTLATAFMEFKSGISKEHTASCQSGSKPEKPKPQDIC